jgi:Zn-dependent protease
VTVSTCAGCGTELSPTALACPACGSLIHADTLKQLASQADEATRAGDLIAARTHWQDALALLPPRAAQYVVVEGRVADLTRQIGVSGVAPSDAPAATKRRWGRAGGIGALAVLLASNLKFLLLGLTKASTFISMFAFFGVYWSIYGWPLAVGVVLGIYVHEMGHVAMLRRFKLDAGAPLFVPGLGALVMLKQRVTDPLTDAMIGLAGPVWGLGAALMALAGYFMTGRDVFFAIAQFTGLLNLFNLIPVWQLDGSRGMHVLSRVERWILVAATASAWYVTGQRMVLVVGGLTVWRAFQREEGPGNSRVLAVFVALVMSLSLLSRGLLN